MMHFDDDLEFLSNFYPASLTFMGIAYPTSEHAFAAMKTEDTGERLKASWIPTPGQAKRFGRTLDLRPGWEYMKRDLMHLIVYAKFYQNSGLVPKLLAVEGEIVEGNHWHDNIWGKCECANCAFHPQLNWLGKILMDVRQAEVQRRVARARRVADGTEDLYAGRSPE